MVHKAEELWHVLPVNIHLTPSVQCSNQDLNLTSSPWYMSAETKKHFVYVIF